MHKKHRPQGSSTNDHNHDLDLELDLYSRTMLHPRLHTQNPMNHTYPNKMKDSDGDCHFDKELCHGFQFDFQHG